MFVFLRFSFRLHVFFEVCVCWGMADCGNGGGKGRFCGLNLFRASLTTPPLTLDLTKPLFPPAPSLPLSILH